MYLNSVQITPVQRGESGKELKTGTGRQELKQKHEGKLLADLLLMACPACFFNRIQDHDNRLGPPQSIDNKENALHLDLMEAFSQLSFLPFR